MKKIFTLIAAALLAVGVQAQTVTWSLSENTNGVATPADQATPAAVTVGEGLKILEATKKFGTINFTQFQPTGDDKGKNEYASVTGLNKYIDFKFTANKDFEVTGVTFNMIKFGTGDPQIFIDVIDGDGTATHLNDNAAIDITRNSSGEEENTGHNYTVSSTVTAGKSFTVRIYVGKLANNKQVGIANFVIKGSVSTGITSVAAAEQNGIVYNLAGQVVGAGFKGIAIQNGKKVVIK